MQLKHNTSSSDRREDSCAEPSMSGLGPHSTAIELSKGLQRVRKAQIEAKQAFHKHRDLQKQMSALRKQVNNAAKELHIKENDLYGKAGQHGRQACLQLCANMYAALPRELRDMIYDELLGPNDLEYVKHLGKARPSLPWWLDEYMGRHVAMEVVKRWYQTRTFIFEGRKLGLLNAFLAVDGFEKGIKPRAHARRFRYHIVIGDHGQELDSVLQKVRHLFSGVEGKVAMKICILSPKEFDHAKKMERIRYILEMLGPTIYKWRKEGFEGLTIWDSSHDTRSKEWTPLNDLTFLCEEYDERDRNNKKLFALATEVLGPDKARDLYA